jgi:outer membrane lipoprotein-sorting protein
MKLSKLAATSALTLVLSLLVGCTNRKPLPVYAPQDAATSLQILRDRTAKIQNISGEAVIKLTDPKGESVHLDGAFVFQPPGRARLRAWKIGQPVFDLTILEDSIWALASRKEATPAMRGAGDTVKLWLRLLMNDFGPDSKATIDDKTITVIRREEHNAGWSSVRAEIDRTTLITRRFIFETEKGEQFNLELSDYRVISDDIVWPFAITATSSTGIIKMTSGNVEVNGQIPSTAFKPPTKAEKLP